MILPGMPGSPGFSIWNTFKNCPPQARIAFDNANAKQFANTLAAREAQQENAGAKAFEQARELVESAPPAEQVSLNSAREWLGQRL